MDVARTRPRPVEIILACYAAIIVVTAVMRIGVSRGNIGIAFAHGLMLLLLWLLLSPRLGRSGQTLRDIAPLLLLLGLYASLDVLSGGGAVPAHDATVMRWEEVLFGGQPARDWWQRQPSAFWSTLLHAVYFSYYLILVTPAVAFLVRGDRPALRRYTRNVIGTFCVCFLVFVFWPVGGPYYTFERPVGITMENMWARLVYASLATGSSFGAAFPSSHVAATTAAWISAWQGWRPLSIALLIPVVLMPVATVYCQMHYAIDAVAGVAIGVVVPVLLGAVRVER